MYSLRTRTTLLNVVAVVVSLVTATIISVVSVAKYGHENCEQSLSLVCETGKNSLNYYFKSVEQSTNSVAS